MLNIVIEWVHPPGRTGAACIVYVCLSVCHLKQQLWAVCWCSDCWPEKIIMDNRYALTQTTQSIYLPSNNGKPRLSLYDPGLYHHYPVHGQRANSKHKRQGDSGGKRKTKTKQKDLLCPILNLIIGPSLTQLSRKNTRVIAIRKASWYHACNQ